MQMNNSIIDNYKTGKNIGLDIIRGIACLSIMLFHYTARYEDIYGHVDNWPFMANHGNYGVLVFFILSGFLAVKTYNSQQKISEKFILKFFRLFPTYWICVIFTFLLTSFFLEDRSVSLISFLANFTMIESFLGFDYVDGAYWTLEYELLFYIVYLVVGNFTKKKGFLHYCFIWIVGLYLVLFLTDKEIPIPYLLRLISLDKYGSLFIIGCSICYFINSKLSDNIFQWCESLLTFILSEIFIILKFDISQFIFTLLICIVFIICEKYPMNVECLEKHQILSIVVSCLLLISSVSYPLYLVHQNLGYVAIHIMESNGLTNELFIIIPILISVFIAIIIHRLIEKNCIDFSKKYIKKIKIKK